MDIEIWDGGLQEQEVRAINKIKTAFSEQLVSPSQNKVRGGSLRDQLGGLKQKSMFPWKGYAGFRFVDAKGREGEFDLVIITHFNILIIELKDWNYGQVTASGDTWFKGDTNMGRSPVSVTRQKTYTLKNKLNSLKHRFTNKGFVPFIDFFVVMTGNAPFDQLPEEQKHHTISLSDFLKFADQDEFYKRCRPQHSKSEVLNQDFNVFDALFIGTQTAPKKLRVDGYEAQEQIFEHPKKVYCEYLAKSEISKGSEALLRVWNFNNIKGDKAFTPEGRAEIVSREREVLQFINHYNRDLYNHCLRSLTSFQKDQITAEYNEVYELPPGHVRFNEFVGKYGKSLSNSDRLIIVKLLIAKFADLHKAKIAHRDIANHSLWISPAKKVALSNFISAYHQPAGTLGDYRESISVGAVEASDMLETSRLSPFQYDVHALGLVVWHLLTGKRMSAKSLETIQKKILASDQWYVPVLLEAIAGTYGSAGTFMDAFMHAEPAGESIPTFDDAELDPYRRPINHSRQYREDGDFIIENGDKEVYISDGSLVKAWLNTGSSGDNPADNFNVLAFLKRVEKLNAVNPDYLPSIKDYGIATKSSSLYLVTEKIEGCTWKDFVFNDENRSEVIARLIASAEHLHSLGQAHGDIHPENVMVDNSGTLFLIDIPDYSPFGQTPGNHRFSPENIDNCTPFERDNFAVMRMACESLGMTWGEASEEYPILANAIMTELADGLFGFNSLARFKKAFAKPVEEQVEALEITISKASEPLSILPDNNHLYVQVKKGQKSDDQAFVTFRGIGGNFSTIYSKKEDRFLFGLVPHERSSVSQQDIDESHFEINVPIRIVPGRPENLQPLSDYLKNDEAFHRAVQLATAPKEPEVKDSLSLQLREAFSKLDQPEEPALAQELDIRTSQLWRAILDTETESYPNIEINGGVLVPENSKDELILSYNADIDALDSFDKTDEIEAVQIVDDEREIILGKVVLKKSAVNEVRLDNVRFRANSLKDGDLVFFRTRQDTSSYRKRKAALERLLDRESVISRLVDYFDPACTEKATNYNIPVTDADFERYDREDNHGNKISLNTKQRDAFTKLINNGPVSLLQGPPGTGKTEFIAAFVHYLIEKQKTKRILLVSQSHEAVNTAAERIRKHCARLDTELEVVRFSNRESAVSEGLKDVYSNAITEEKLELFKAECKYRVEALSGALGLDPEFISSYVQAELELFRQIDSLEILLKQLSSATEDDRESLKAIVTDLDTNIRGTLSIKYSISLPQSENLSTAKELLTAKLCRDFSVMPDEVRRVKALAKISRDMQDVLSGERVNYDEFYARSRQLVTGTCVGIGKGHIGINDIVYDWIIIDEAARSIASELAIAMQSAKRVLLVGDHLQLPPLYSDAHKQALARKLGIANTGADLDEVLRSDFARAFNSAYGQNVSAALLTQYRMAAPIGKLVSQTFYDGQLENGDRVIPDIYNTAPAALNSVVTWLDTSSLNGRARHQDDRGVSIYNRSEADQIIGLLKEISDNDSFVQALSGLIGKGEAAIGVICMYGEQKRVLRQKFNQQTWSDGFKDIVKIDTVDSYQGKENRIIILSLTRSDKRQSPGFLRTPNRINVAMSRAMDRLLIVGDSTMWTGINKNLPLGQVVRFMSEQGEPNGYRFLNAKPGSKKQ